MRQLIDERQVLVVESRRAGDNLADRCDLCLLQDVTPVATERCGALVNGTRRAELGCGVALAGMVREPAVEPSLEAASIGLAR